MASSAWIAERVFGVQTPVDKVVNGLAQTGVWGAAALLALSLGATYAPTRRELDEPNNNGPD